MKGKKETSSKDEFVINALNTHGLFFHQKCISEISENERWGVFEKEFPVSVGNSSTNIDIVAARDCNGHRFWGIFECKKLDNSFKTWVFFEDKKNGKNDKSVLSSVDINHLGYVPDSLKVIPMDCIFPKSKKSRFLKDRVGEHRHDIILGKTNHLGSLFGSMKTHTCYDSFELKINYDIPYDPSTNYIKAARKQNIERACFQALLGSRGYALNRYKQFLKYKDLTEEEKNKIYPLIETFIPIVVTTSKLKICDTVPRNIDLKSGEIITKKDVSFEDVPWLIYNYRPTDIILQILSREMPEEYNLFANNKSFDFVSSIFFVNAEHLDEFLSILPPQ